MSDLGAPRGQRLGVRVRGSQEDLRSVQENMAMLRYKQRFIESFKNDYVHSTKTPIDLKPRNSGNGVHSGHNAARCLQLLPDSKPPASMSRPVTGKSPTCMHNRIVNGRTIWTCLLRMKALLMFNPDNNPDIKEAHLCCRPVVEMSRSICYRSNHKKTLQVYERVWESSGVPLPF